MNYSLKFVSRNEKISTFTAPVPMPLMRRSFNLDAIPDKAEITVCGLGFYEMYVNGEKLARGRLTPYVTNPDQLLPYDSYDIKPLLTKGKNTVAFILGSGSQNAHTSGWGLNKVRFLSSPKLAFSIDLTRGEAVESIEADEKVLTADSEITFSDLRYGETVDARLIKEGWALPDYDDSAWDPAISVQTPSGETMTVSSDPIVETHRISPVKIWFEDDGYVYDFGINGAGLTELTVNGAPGQKIEIWHADEFLDEGGKLSFTNLHSRVATEYEPKKQLTTYICRGEGTEKYIPRFTYYGFRYAKVFGITKEQATADLLTYVCINSHLEEIGDFNCSDESLCKLYRMTKQATVSNFHHFPTDCPHREKHGWTADAALSAEHTLLNYKPDNSYKMWLRAVCRAQSFAGALPGVVPTGGYGFAWGNGPAWDSVLPMLPYALWQFRGDLSAARDCAGSFMRYAHYVSTRRDSRGLVAIGLGDWCHPKKYIDGVRTNEDDPETLSPLVFTDSVYTYFNANMFADMLDAIGMPRDGEYCRGLAREMREAIRTHLLDRENMIFCKGDQTSQSMAIFYGLCDTKEEELAYSALLAAIKRADDHLTTGVLGARVMFRVLADHGDADLAIKLITRPDPPSYGVMIADGHTTLTEHAEHETTSRNHHFWGDIAALMIKYFAGIRIDYRNTGAGISLNPVFPGSLSHASAKTETPSGKISVSWKRVGRTIEYTVDCPEDGVTLFKLPEDYAFMDGSSEIPLATGTYVIKEIG